MYVRIKWALRVLRTELQAGGWLSRAQEFKAFQAKNLKGIQNSSEFQPVPLKVLAFEALLTEASSSQSLLELTGRLQVENSKGYSTAVSGVKLRETGKHMANTCK